MKNELIKEADVIPGFSELLSSLKHSVVGLTDIKEHPFQTIFKYFGNGLLMYLGWKTRILFVVAKLLGLDLADIGKIIDTYLGFGGGNSPTITDSSLKGAASGIVNKIFGMMKTSELYSDDLYKIAKKPNVNNI